MKTTRPGLHTSGKAETKLFSDKLQKIDAERRKVEDIERMIDAKVALALRRLLP